MARHDFEYVTHYYTSDDNPWVSDLMYLAKYTGKTIDPKQYYESPAEIQRYINVINPILPLAGATQKLAKSFKKSTWFAQEANEVTSQLPFDLRLTTNGN